MCDGLYLILLKRCWSASSTSWVIGNRKRGRPKTAWIDNVTSWTGLKLEDTIRSGKWTTDLHGERRFIVWPTLGLRTAKDKQGNYN